MQLLFYSLLLNSVRPEKKEETILLSEIFYNNDTTGFPCPCRSGSEDGVRIGKGILIEHQRFTVDTEVVVGCKVHLSSPLRCPLLVFLKYD